MRREPDAYPLETPVTARPIDELLRDRLSGDVSLRDLARRMGDESVYRNIHRISTGDLKAFPKPETIQGIAHVLSISEAECVLSIWAALRAGLSEPPAEAVA